MPSLKEYKAKLTSLQNTRKITKTMKMVAASKLNKAMAAQRNALLFNEKVHELIGRLAATVDERSHPLLRTVESPKNILYVVFTSDKGLCAGFNNNLIRMLRRHLQSPEHSAQNNVLSFCGRRGYLALRSRVKVDKHYEGVTVRPAHGDAVSIANDICDAFIAGKYDEVYLVFNHFINPLSQKPQIQRLLPIQQDVMQAADGALPSEIILEPAEKEILGRLVPKVVQFEIYFALLENAAGENGARMTAMDNATSNATNLINYYTLMRNRARQASITKELIEIVSGAEALKG
jgi:F-type H+-transporting ATPase subunit gamma